MSTVVARDHITRGAAMVEPISVLARAALSDAGRVVEQLDVTAFESFAQAIAGAKTIALHGLGREGLQMKGLAMRLFHGSISYLTLLFVAVGVDPLLPF